MNRRDFFKKAGLAVTIPAIAITCKYEDDEKGPEKESSKTGEGWKRWDHVVICHERNHGEHTFTKNTRGSFAYQREYVTFDEENDLTWNGKTAYAGWMDQGSLHFAGFHEASDFVWMHVQTKEDTNILDSIYDIYELSFVGEEKPVHMLKAHYWFNGDTGAQIIWEHSSGSIDGLGQSLVAREKLKLQNPRLFKTNYRNLT